MKCTNTTWQIIRKRRHVLRLPLILWGRGRKIWTVDEYCSFGNFFCGETSISFKYTAPDTARSHVKTWIINMQDTNLQFYREGLNKKESGRIFKKKIDVINKRKEAGADVASVSRKMNIAESNIRKWSPRKYFTK